MGFLHSRKQVRNDAVKQRQVVPQELWHVDVTQCAQQQHLLRLSGAGPLQVACTTGQARRIRRAVHPPHVSVHATAPWSCPFSTQAQPLACNRMLTLLVAA